MLSGPFSPWPSYSEDEAASVQAVLLSNRVNYWTGNEGRQFEQEFAAFSHCEYAVAVANGTVALDLALRSLELSPGDEVVVTSRTFFASVSSIVNAGLVPVFADVSLRSQNVTAETIRSSLTERTKAVLCVHLSGMPCDMDPILELAEQYGLLVIEDCAQAHGAKYKGKPVGSLGHVAAWSFCQDKIMTTGGEGGMVTTNHKALWSKIWSMKDHGKSWEAVYERKHPSGFKWLHESFGTNWRMTEIQAVLGRIQLGRMKDWHEKRVRYANQIWETAVGISRLRVPSFDCSGCSGFVCNSETQCEQAAYKCYVFLDGTTSDRDSIVAKINDLGVPCFSGSCSEVYLEKAFDRTTMRPKNRLSNAKLLGEISLMFLCHPSLSQAEIDKTCDVLRKVVGSYFEES